MMRLIDAGNVNPSDIFVIGPMGQFDFENAVKQLLYQQPVIDPVHAAGACYCGECRNCVHQPGLPKVEWICVEEHNYCECGAKIVTPNHFCGYGVKKE